MDRVLDLAEQFAESGATEIGFGDTTGMCNPAYASRFFAAAIERLPGVEVTAHFHNTRGQGLANAYAALEAGCTSFESSFGELGGCPVPDGLDRQHRHRGPREHVPRDGRRHRARPRRRSSTPPARRRACSVASSPATPSSPGPSSGTRPSEPQPTPRQEELHMSNRVAHGHRWCPGHRQGHRHHAGRRRASGSRSPTSTSTSPSRRPRRSAPPAARRSPCEIDVTVHRVGAGRGGDRRAASSARSRSWSTTPAGTTSCRS